MEKRIRKYYRVNVLRIPPYSLINGTYQYEEDVWAYSEEGAKNKITRQHKNCCGRHIPREVIEISKEDFRGDKVVKDCREQGISTYQYKESHQESGRFYTGWNYMNFEIWFEDDDTCSIYDIPESDRNEYLSETEIEELRGLIYNLYKDKISL